jgi:hypothetical protein
MNNDIIVNTILNQLNINIKIDNKKEFKDRIIYNKADNNTLRASYIHFLNPGLYFGFEGKSADIFYNAGTDSYDITETYFNSKIKNENGDAKHILIRKIADVYCENLSEIIKDFFIEEINPKDLIK